MIGATAEVIGRGGSALVCALPDGRVAKIFHGRSPSVDARVAREAALMRRVGSPPMARLFEATTTRDGRSALVMERLGGKTLATVLAAAEGPLSAERALVIMARIVARVASLHRAGVVHCDLKPSNLMIGEHGDVRVLDAGLAVALDEGRPTAQVGGTLEYVSPEVLRGDRVDARADVYALGVILFEMLTLRTPFVGEPAAVRHGHAMLWPPRVGELVPTPRALADVVDACLAKDPARRPADADALAGELERSTESTAVTVPARLRTLASGGVRPAAVLAIEAELAWSDIDRAIQPHAGVIARRGRNGVVAVFELDRSAPIDRALWAAHALVERGARRVVVHVAPIRLRPGSRVVAVGAALDDPNAWTPSTPATGVVVTQAASAADRPRRSDAPRLVGRGPELDALRRALDDAFDGRRTVPTVIVGPPGSGRSRMLREAGELVRAAGARVVLLEAGPDRRGALATALGVEGRELLPLVAAIAQIARRERLAILLDDVTPADRELIATLAGVMVANPLWVCAAGDADPAAHANAVTVGLGPLSTTDAEALVTEMLPSCPLAPAMRQQLVTWAGSRAGVRAELSVLVRATGAMRPVPGSALWEIDPTAVERITPSTAHQWLADRQCDALLPELAVLARLCAVLGTEIDETEVVEVCRELVADGVPASSFADPAIAWPALVQHGVLAAQRGRLGFRGEASRAAYAAGLDEDTTLRIRAAALAVARRSTAADRLQRIARHARGDEAHDAQLALARAAEREHAHHATELYVGLAVESAVDDRERMQLLLRRCRARRLSTRYEAALEDAARARELAARYGDACVEAEALLQAAAVRDQTEGFGIAADLVARASALLDGRAVSSAQQALLDNRRGVVARREGRLADAAIALAAACSSRDADADVRRGSALLLSRVLAGLGRRAEGLAILDAAIAECEADHDYFHVVSGLLNRVTFSSEAGLLERARADADRGHAIARDMGFVQLAIWIDHNLSLASWWNGDLASAEVAARRAHELGVQRFRDCPNVTGTAQLAVYVVAAGRLDEAAPLLDRLRRTHGGGRSHEKAVELLELAVGARDGWEPVLATLDHPQERVEALWLRAHCERRRGDCSSACAALAEAIAIARDHGAGLRDVLEREHAALA